MPRLGEVLPDLADELASCLRASGDVDLAAQLEDVEVVRWTHDSTSDAMWIDLWSPRRLNVVEQNVIGVRHGRSVAVEHDRWVHVDTDNFDRLTRLELLSPGDVSERLARSIPSLRG